MTRVRFSSAASSPAATGLKAGAAAPMQMQPMLVRPRRCLAVLLAVLASVGALTGCGSGGDADSATSAGEAALVPWPLFGRVPERTHYLPAPPRRALDPPLREAWSINTHALIEFPPAVAGGVAYLVNKYGNAKAVRLSDRKILQRGRGSRL
jgi:hypothetical protein